MLDWIKNCVFYQIYPTSFYDSNGDGIGDLNGISEKVDYLKSLGVGAIWLNPIYKSPFKDGGYDISDYREIDKKFGTMADLENLINKLHANGVKIVLDLVIGHTSDKHKWFKKSALSKRNEYYDYYVWTDNVFQDYPGLIRGLYYRDGGYLPNYYASQPSLNFGFEKVEDGQTWQLHYEDERLRPLREEIINMMRFYLDKGIDGFRVDMAGSLIKGGATFGDIYDESEDGLDGVKWLWNEILGTLRKEYQDKVYIAEWVLPQRSIGMCGFDMDFLTHDTIPFNCLYRNEKGCNLSDIDYYVRGFNYFSPEGKGDLKQFVDYVNFAYTKVANKGMFSAPTTTHDEIRMPTNKSDDLVKTIFAFMLTLKHVPFIYYGDEIGMEHNFAVSKDGGGIRTGARTPMQWTEEKGRGFSTKKNTYLPISKIKNKSVQAQNDNDNSLLNTVKELIKIKKAFKSLNADAKQEFIEYGYPGVFERVCDDETIRVYVNPSNNVVERNCKYKKVLLSNNAIFDKDNITLKAQSFAIVLM